MIEKLKRKIAIATAVTLGIYLTLFLLLVSPGWWVEFLSDLPNWVDIIKWVIPLVFTVIAYFLVNFLDIHNWLDKTFFKERKKVDDYIRTQLTTPCREISCGRANRGVLRVEEQRLMNLFYTFIPADNTERERAFSYWGEYFIAVNLSTISILGFIGALVAIAFDSSRATHYAFIIILVFALLLNFARIKNRKKLLRPAQAQTTKIINDNSNELKANLHKCRTQCEECPLTASNS